jgi:uncharacterized protein (DUF4415 family)
MALDDPRDPLAIYDDKPVDDSDNPEWTEEDYRRAKPMPEEILNTFPRMRGRPRKPPEEKKVQISIKLHPMVLNHYKAKGPGWQTRMEQVLIDAAFEETTTENLQAQAAEQRPKRSRHQAVKADSEFGLRVLKTLGPKAKKRSAAKKVGTKPKRVPSRRLKA